MNKRIYKFVVEGQYIAMSQNAKILKKYKAEFVLPSPDSALSVIVSKLLDDKLKILYEDYIKYRTHKITGRTIVGEKPNRGVLELEVERMNYEQLTDFCLLKDIAVDPFKHGTIQLARQAVEKSWEGVKERQRESQKDAAKNKESDELKRLNGIPTDEQNNTYTNEPSVEAPTDKKMADAESAEIS